MLCLMGKALHHDPTKLGAGNAGRIVRGAGSSSRRVLSGFGGAISAQVLRLTVWPGPRSSMARGAAWPSWRYGRSGGFLRFSAGALARVRIVESEWQGQGIGFAALSVSQYQPDRLHRGHCGRAGSGPEGVNPPRDRLPLPLPVADGRYQIGEKFPAKARIVTIADCSTSDSVGLKVGAGDFGREIPSAPLGSGVRAAQSAGFSDPGQRRPKYSQTEGLGGGLVRSSAKDFSEAGRLGPGGDSVN